VHDVVDRARNHEYDDKTLLFCWVRSSTPYHSSVGVCDEPPAAWQSVSLAFLRRHTLPAIVVPCTVQEHKNIPYIVGELGLSGHELHWGLDPESGVRPMAIVSGSAANSSRYP
jgi:hypothetical protein